MSLFSKILLSLVVTVFIALALVMLMTRVNMNRGMIEYVEQQEAAQLIILAPELAELYIENGDWDFLHSSPRRWNHLLRIMRPIEQDGPGSRPPIGGRPPGANRSANERHIERSSRPPNERHPERSNRSRQRPPGNLRGRLFLLDADRNWVAGASYDENQAPQLEAIDVQGAPVGWLGFTPLRNMLPPEARLFVAGQSRALLVSLFAGLIIALILGLMLARHISRPLRELAQTVDTLSSGNYEVRATVARKDEVGRLGKGVNRLAESLAENRSIRRRWMADIAHELRTPVAVLKGEIEALQDGLRPADESTLASLGEEAEQLSRLIDDLQTLALSDAGALEVQMETLDFSGLVRQQLRTFSSRLADQNIRVSEKLPETAMIHGDAQRLRQLLHNLLENSCRYVDEHGSLELTIVPGEETMTLLLDDSGPGLTDDQRSSLFERFYRADASRSRANGGSGLGLSICRNIARAHHGKIRALNSPLGGLRIELVLPS